MTAIVSIVSSFWSAAQSSLSFLFSTVLPIAFVQIGRWLYDWQVLVAGALVLIAARIWGTSILRAAQYEKSRIARLWEPDPTLVETAHGGDADPAEIFAGADLDSDTEILKRQLEDLRRRIRIVLAKLPCTDDPPTAEHQALYKRVKEFNVEGARLSGQEANIPVLQRLQAELSVLETPSGAASCRDIWSALAQASATARRLIAELDASAAPTQGSI